MRNDDKVAGGVVSSSSHDDIRKLLLSSSLSSLSSSKLSSLEEIHKHNIHSAAQDLLHSIRERVKTMTGLTCSAGLASNYLLFSQRLLVISISQMDNISLGHPKMK